MKKIISLILISTSFLSLQGQSNQTNPLLEKWVGFYGGVPAFNEYKISDFKPAFELAIEQKWKEIDLISNNLRKPNFDNTIAALELSGKAYNRVLSIFGIFSSNMNSPEFALIEAEISPKIADVSSKFYQNKKLFLRIEALNNSPEKKKLTKEQQRLIELYYKNFVREGAQLNDKSKLEVAYY